MNKTTTKTRNNVFLLQFLSNCKQPQGKLPMQQTQKEELSFRLDCQGPVSPLPFLPHPLEKSLEDYQPLIVALPSHTNLTNLNHPHFPPMIASKQTNMKHKNAKPNT